MTDDEFVKSELNRLAWYFQKKLGISEQDAKERAAMEISIMLVGEST